MLIIDQTKIYQNYKGQWVVLDNTGTKVLAAASNLDQAIAKYHKKYGEKDVPLTFKVPTKLVSYIGC